MLWLTIRRLHSQDRTKKLQAIQELARSRDPDALRELLGQWELSSNDRGLEDAVGDALLGWGKPALEPLLELIKRGRLHESTAKLVARIEGPLVPSLLSLLNDRAAHVRSSALLALEYVESQEIAQPLTRAFQQETDESLRSRVLGALSRLPGQHASEAIISALDDPSAKVKAAAVDAVAFRKDRHAAEPLVKFLAGWRARLEAPNLGQKERDDYETLLLHAADVLEDSLGVRPPSPPFAPPYKSLGATKEAIQYGMFNEGEGGSAIKIVFESVPAGYPYVYCSIKCSCSAFISHRFLYYGATGGGQKWCEKCGKQVRIGFSSLKLDQGRGFFLTAEVNDRCPVRDLSLRRVI